MSLVAFRAQNHPQQPTKDHVDDRRTPVGFFDGLCKVHRFSVDAAASPDNALLPRYWTRETNALLQSWSGERVWCNPPFSKLAPWVMKAWSEMQRGCEVVVMLLPGNRCEQPFWQEHVEPYRDRGPITQGIRLTTRFLPGRMRFGRPLGVHWVSVEKKGFRPPFGCVLLTWERDRA